MTPVDAFNDRPAGNWPDAMLHVYEGLPPVAARLALYAVPDVLTGNEDVEIASVELPCCTGFPGEATVTGTEFESLPVCLLCTVRATTAGEAMLLLWTEVDNVFASTTDVGRA